MRDGRSFARTRWIGLSLVGLVGGCGLGNPDLVFSSDVGVIIPVDVPVVDAPVDTGVDVPVDRPGDTGVDVPDVGTDAGVDVPDVGTDVGTDAGFDVPDVGTDVGFDAGFDAGFDVGFDVGFDLGFDVGFDVPDVPPPCPTGQTMCSTGCFDLANDVAHCGGCTTVCALPNATPACTAGACAVAGCAAGHGNCDGLPANGCEADTVSSLVNCGACGNACAAGSVCAAGACRLPTGCSELHATRPTLPSGEYTVDADGAGAGAATTVRCDMTTDGGGWTLAFDSITRSGLGWNRPDVAAAIFAASPAAEALVAHRDAAFEPVAGVSWARFAAPAGWRTAAPLVPVTSDVDVSVSISGAAPVVRQLRAGYGIYEDNCNGAWVAGSFGRFCIAQTNAPFFAEFAGGGAGRCPTSDLSWNGGPPTNVCSAARRFTIYLR